MKVLQSFFYSQYNKRKTAGSNYSILSCVKFLVSLLLCNENASEESVICMSVVSFSYLVFVKFMSHKYRYFSIQKILYTRSKSTNVVQHICTDVCYEQCSPTLCSFHTSHSTTNLFQRLQLLAVVKMKVSKMRFFFTSEDSSNV